MQNRNSKFKIFTFYTVIFIFTFLIFNFAPFGASAALIPCGPGTSKPTCQFCDLAELIGRVINFGIKLVIPIGVVFIAWGGIVILTASGSTEKAKKGRDILTAAIIGIVIALIAWLLVHQFLNIITGNKMGLDPAKFSAEFCPK
jgi:hypothetical protein